MLPEPDGTAAGLHPAMTRFDSVREYQIEGDDSAGEEAVLIKPYRVGSTPRSPTKDAELKAD